MRFRFDARPLAALCVVVVFSLTTTASHACFIRSPLPVQVWMDHIKVDIVDQVATKTYHCVFKNPNPRAVIDGICYMELEPRAQVDGMSVRIDGKKYEAEILNADKAKRVFTDMVKNGGSPALLEYFGNQLIQTKVPRIEPNGTVTVKLQYTTILPARGGLVRLQMLNTNPKALMQKLKSASVAVNINSTRPIKNVYSPTHKIKIVEKPKWDVSVRWKEDDYLPKHPFVLYYQLAEDKVGASLVAHKDKGAPGAFLLMLSPTVGKGQDAVTEADILPKDVVFCVDTSGSMLEQSKLEQARGALEYCVKSLRDGDRFNIVDFSTVARNLSEDGLLEFNDQTKRQALEYVAELHARGGTAILEALETSLKQLKLGSYRHGERNSGSTVSADASRLKMIVFATDGLPTIGETDAAKLLAAVDRENTIDARMFVFGEGYDVNTSLLDFLALDHRGEADYILPDENIEEKISRFFDRVGSPIMTDLEVDFGGLKVDDVFPRKIADIYKGEQIVILGRYKGGGSRNITVTGNVGGDRKTFTYELDFPKRSEDDKHAFVHRLWAGRKVDFLLSEIRKHDGPPKELVTEATRLAKRYGIVTPYTSYLMTDDVIYRRESEELTRLGKSIRELDMPNELSTLGLGLGGALGLEAKQRGIAASKAANDQRRLQSRSGGLNAFYDSFGVVEENSEAAKALFGRRSDREGQPIRRRSSLAALRHIGTQTFYNSESDQTWYQSDFDPTKTKISRAVKVGSDEYVDLLLKDGRLAKFFALGNVVLKVDREWLRIKGDG